MKRLNGKSRIAALALALVTTASLALWADQGATSAPEPKPASVPPPPGGHMGMVVTYFYYAMYQGPDACPHGMAHVQTSPEFLSKLPAEEQARLLRPENKRELFLRMVKRGPNGENVCRAPWSVADPQMTTLSGTRNDGLDLDGSADDKAQTDYTCSHTQFRGSDGTLGVDNQLGRIYACLTGMREQGTLVSYFTQAMHEGMWSMLIDLSGVDDRRNDPDVTVDIYAGQDAMPMDSTGKVLANASLTASADPRFHRQLKARIIDGVLETMPAADLLIPDTQAKFRPPMRIQRPKLKLTLQNDGTAKGYLGGYIATERLTQSSFDGEAELAKGVPCDGVWHALQKFADGARDHSTGKCNSISTAFRIETVPAFIVSPRSAARN